MNEGVIYSAKMWCIVVTLDVCTAGVEQVHMRELAAIYAAGEAAGIQARCEMLTKSRLQVLNTDQDQVEYFMPSPTGPVQVSHT